MKPASLGVILSCLLAGVSLADDIAYVTCQNGDALSILDITGRTETARLVLPGKPAGIAVVPGFGVYTVSPDTKTVRRIDPDTQEIIAQISLDGGPIGIAVDASRGHVFVSDWYNSRIWVLAVADLSLVNTLPTGAAPAGLAMSDHGEYLAAAERDANQVRIFDAETLTDLHATPTGNRPFGLRFSPDGRLFVANVGSNDVAVVDPSTGTVIARLPVGERPYGVAFANNRAFISNQYANTVSVFDLDALLPVATIAVGEYPEGIDNASDGSKIYVVNWFDNSLSMIDSASLDVIGEIATADGPRAFGEFVGEVDR